jgi:hypothetical protein
VVHRFSLTLEPGCHPLNPIKRGCGELLIDEVHQMQIVAVIPLGVIVIGGSGKTEQLALPPDRNYFISRIDQCSFLLY